MPPALALLLGSTFPETAAARLKTSGHGFANERIEYADAEHITTIPCLPAADVFHGLIFGGDYQQSSRRNIEAWNIMLEFFEKHLR